MFNRGAIDQDVVKENSDALSKEGVKDRVHKILKGGRGVGEAKRHYHELVKPLMSAEGDLEDVGGGDMDLMITCTQIQLLITEG